MPHSNWHGLVNEGTGQRIKKKKFIDAVEIQIFLYTAFEDFDSYVKIEGYPKSNEFEICCFSDSPGS